MNYCCSHRHRKMTHLFRLVKEWCHSRIIEMPDHQLQFHNRRRNHNNRYSISFALNFAKNNDSIYLDTTAWPVASSYAAFTGKFHVISTYGFFFFEICLSFDIFFSTNSHHHRHKMIPHLFHSKTSEMSLHLMQFHIHNHNNSR